jgi:hypothetical protein
VALNITNNPVEFIHNSPILYLERKVKAWNRFRKTYFINRLKTRFRDYFWKKVIAPKIEARYHPDNLVLLLGGLTGENDNVPFDDDVLEHW